MNYLSNNCDLNACRLLQWSLLLQPAQEKDACHQFGDISYFAPLEQKGGRDPRARVVRAVCTVRRAFSSRLCINLRLD